MCIKGWCYWETHLVLIILHEVLEEDHELLELRGARRLQLVLQRDDDGHHVLYHVLLHHLLDGDSGRPVRGETMV